MANTMLDPNARLTVVSALMMERRRDAADARLARMAARARAKARRLTDAVRPSAPAREARASRPARAIGHGG